MKMAYEHLSIFQRNDIDKLYKLTIKLWSLGTFKYYLNNQQLLVLQVILEHETDSKGIFRAFMNSGVSFKFVEKIKKKIPSADKEADEISPSVNQEINFNESSIANGVESARQLALKIRYILWDKAIDYYYDDEKDLKEYELFEESDNEEQKAEDQLIKAPDITEVTTEAVIKGRVIKEDDNYDDDEDEEQEQEEHQKEAPAETKPTQEQAIEHQKDEQGNVILEVPIVDNDEDLHQLDNKILISNFNKIYHNFEHDKETLIKRKKLEENDKLIEETEANEEEEIQETTKDGKPVKDPATKSKPKKDTLSMNLGAANLSLKHLLRSIEENKSKLNLSDTELRQLITDVRKNRSKWASDEKIGQEELYEACEKVIMELRGYTEHSTAFLNKVSKRDAPNYSQIIKTPMDLNTILKKLKTYQYKTKTQFVDDVMLIWKNCLTYNVDPKHFLRAHAIAMQKKSASLIHLIPDITVKDRKEVEEAYQEETATPGPGAGGKNTAGKGKKRSRNGEVLEREVEEKEEEEKKKDDMGEVVVKIEEGDSTKDQISAVSQPICDDDENEGDSNEYLNVEDNDKDDFETQSWKNLTSKARADYCISRSLLFKEPVEESIPKKGEEDLKKNFVPELLRLNENADALVRDKTHMKEFGTYLDNYQSKKRKVQAVVDEQKQPQDTTADEQALYLMEYDVSSGIPGIPYIGLTSEDLDAEETKLISEVMRNGLKPSCYSPGSTGLNGVINGNIELMQDIRRICFKISIIRQMQQQQFVHHTQMRTPSIDAIDDSVDLDPISRLKTHDQKDKVVVFNVLRKRVAKMIMQTGFETSESFAIDTMTQIAGDYMTNLIRSIKMHLETPSVNKDIRFRNVLRMALVQNGISKPDELHTYVHENVIRQGTKLKDLKAKLLGFLKVLLRPAVSGQELNESAFEDNSEQFVNGDFSNEIGGDDDFFGFKELGLEKELGTLGNTIPLHLLQSRLSAQNQVDTSGKPHREEFEKYKPQPVTQDTIEEQVQTFQPILRELLAKLKVTNSKQFKTKREMNEYIATVQGLVLPEEEDYTKKTNKSKLPPNGKIQVTLKKKISTVSYFIPEETICLEPPEIKPVGPKGKKITIKVKKEDKLPAQSESEVSEDEEDDELKSEGPSMLLGSGLSPIVEVNGK